MAADTCTGDVNRVLCLFRSFNPHSRSMRCTQLELSPERGRRSSLCDSFSRAISLRDLSSFHSHLLLLVSFELRSSRKDFYATYMLLWERKQALGLAQYILY